MSRTPTSATWPKCVSIYARLLVLTVSQIKVPNVRYEYFDFHNQCKNMQWDRLSLLVDNLQKDLIKQGLVLPFHLPLLIVLG
jgi:hypothetical protein